MAASPQTEILAWSMLELDPQGDQASRFPHGRRRGWKSVRADSRSCDKLREAEELPPPAVIPRAKRGRGGKISSRASVHTVRAFIEDSDEGYSDEDGGAVIWDSTVQPSGNRLVGGGLPTTGTCGLDDSLWMISSKWRGGIARGFGDFASQEAYEAGWGRVTRGRCGELAALLPTLTYSTPPQGTYDSAIGHLYHCGDHDVANQLLCIVDALAQRFVGLCPAEPLPLTPPPRSNLIHTGHDVSNNNHVLSRVLVSAALAPSPEGRSTEEDESAPPTTPLLSPQLWGFIFPRDPSLYPPVDPSTDAPFKIVFSHAIDLHPWLRTVRSLYGVGGGRYGRWAYLKHVAGVLENILGCSQPQQKSSCQNIQQNPQILGGKIGSDDSEEDLRRPQQSNVVFQYLGLSSILSSNVSLQKASFSDLHARAVFTALLSAYVRGTQAAVEFQLQHRSWLPFLESRGKAALVPGSAREVTGVSSGASAPLYLMFSSKEPPLPIPCNPGGGGHCGVGADGPVARLLRCFFKVLDSSHPASCPVREMVCHSLCSCVTHCSEILLRAIGVSSVFSLARCAAQAWGGGESFPPNESADTASCAYALTMMADLEIAVDRIQSELTLDILNGDLTGLKGRGNSWVRQGFMTAMGGLLGGHRIGVGGREFCPSLTNPSYSTKSLTPLPLNPEQLRVGGGLVNPTTNPHTQLYCWGPLSGKGGHDAFEGKGSPLPPPPVLVVDTSTSTKEASSPMMANPLSYSAHQKMKGSEYPLYAHLPRTPSFLPPTDSTTMGDTSFPSSMQRVWEEIRLIAPDALHCKSHSRAQMTSANLQGTLRSGAELQRHITSLLTASAFCYALTESDSDSLPSPPGLELWDSPSTTTGILENSPGKSALNSVSHSIVINDSGAVKVGFSGAINGCSGSLIVTLSFPQFSLSPPSPQFLRAFGLSCPFEDGTNACQAPSIPVTPLTFSFSLPLSISLLHQLNLLPKIVSTINTPHLIDNTNSRGNKRRYREDEIQGGLLRVGENFSYSIGKFPAEFCSLIFPSPHSLSVHPKSKIGSGVKLLPPGTLHIASPISKRLLHAYGLVSLMRSIWHSCDAATSSAQSGSDSNVTSRAAKRSKLCSPHGWPFPWSALTSHSSKSAMVECLPLAKEALFAVKEALESLVSKAGIDVGSGSKETLFSAVLSRLHGFLVADIIGGDNQGPTKPCFSGSVLWTFVKNSVDNWFKDSSSTPSSSLLPFSPVSHMVFDAEFKPWETPPWVRDSVVHFSPPAYVPVNSIVSLTSSEAAATKPTSISSTKPVSIINPTISTASATKSSPITSTKPASVSVTSKTSTTKTSPITSSTPASVSTTSSTAATKSTPITSTVSVTNPATTTTAASAKEAAREVTPLSYARSDNSIQGALQPQPSLLQTNLGIDPDMKKPVVCPTCTMESVAVSSIAKDTPMLNCEGCNFPLGGRCKLCQVFYRAGKYSGWEKNSNTGVWVEISKEAILDTACIEHSVGKLQQEGSALKIVSGGIRALSPSWRPPTASNPAPAKDSNTALVWRLVSAWI